MESGFFDYSGDSQEYHAHSWDSVDDPVRYREDEICTDKTPNYRYSPANPEKPSRDIPALMELIQSSEDVSDLPELVGDARELRAHTNCCHESNPKDRHSTWRETPEVRREESDEEKDEDFEFWRH